MADWKQVGFTYYNDPPPGAGNLRWGGYSFAELGAATRTGAPTGPGNLARAFGLGFVEPMGSEWSLYAGHQVVLARKEDVGYGQGGDGTHSDPRYAIDLYDGSAYGLPNLPAALGVGEPGALWIMRGRWRTPERLPGGQATLQAAPLELVNAPSQSQATTTSVDKHDYHQKVQQTGKTAGEHGSSLQHINTKLSGIPGRYRR